MDTAGSIKVRGTRVKGNSQRAAVMLCFLLAAVAASGCSSVNSLMGGSSVQQARSQLKWTAAKKAINIKLSAARDLNSYKHQPHTLVLAVFQTNDPNTFLAALATPAGVGALLESGKTGPAMPFSADTQAKILNFRQYIIVPGQREKLSLERVAGARYVGVLAGYYGMDTEKIVRLYAVPVVLSTDGWIIKRRKMTPGNLDLDLALGASAIETCKRSPVKDEQPYGANNANGEIAVTSQAIQLAEASLTGSSGTTNGKGH